MGSSRDRTVLGERVITVTRYLSSESSAFLDSDHWIYLMGLELHVAFTAHPIE